MNKWLRRQNSYGVWFESFLFGVSFLHTPQANDSQFCMDYLGEKLGINVTKKELPELSAQDLAQGRCLRIMLEDHFYWCLATLGEIS